MLGVYVFACCWKVPPLPDNDGADWGLKALRDGRILSCCWNDPAPPPLPDGDVKADPLGAIGCGIWKGLAVTGKSVRLGWPMNARTLFRFSSAATL